MLVVVALWLGATAYISSLFKEEMRGTIQRANALNESTGMSISADVNSGFFTSNMSLNQKHLELFPLLQLAMIQNGIKIENDNYATFIQHQPKILKVNGEDKTQNVLPLLELMLVVQNPALQEEATPYAIPVDENTSMDQNDKEYANGGVYSETDDENRSMDEEEESVSAEDNNESI